MKIEIGYTDIKGAFRTAGALMVGNSIVLPLLTDADPSWWWLVFVLGCGIILSTTVSIAKGE
ncbi:MAG: hypothetical protein QM533_05075 [Cytophagales bacterium]|nr:hypothetical protein [Cytophagales bacterium]